VENIVAPDFNPGNKKRRQATRPRENARKSKGHISDGMKKILKKANILCSR
jgi:hypothetical protein